MMSEYETQLALDYAFENNKKLALSILLLYYCFIRPGEQRQMIPSYIDLDNGVITLPGHITKNKKTEHITIPTQLITVLRSLIDPDWHQHDYIFGKNMEVHPSLMCGSNSLANAHIKVIDALVKQKKLHNTDGISIYSWKDTGAMALIRAGIDPYEIMRQMRHSDLNTTQKYLKSLHSINVSIRDQSANLLLPKLTT